MVKLYEYYNTGDNQSYGFGQVNWSAQTFTPSVTHSVTSVKLKLYRNGAIGTISVGIRLADGVGKPTGADIGFGTYDGDTLGIISPGNWIEVIFSSPASVVVGIQYALVVRAPNAAIGTGLIWRRVGPGATYAGGTEVDSDDSGVTWYDPDPNDDMMFEEWGNPPNPKKGVRGVLRTPGASKRNGSALWAPPLIRIPDDP